MREALLERINRGFVDGVPHNKALGMRVVDFGRGEVTIRLPYDARFVGHPATGVLHGGVVTALLDASCGASVFTKLAEPAPIATLDLRIDYLKPAVARLDLIAKAHCYKLTRNVAFVRCVAYQDDESDPVATAAGAFMLATKGKSAMSEHVP
jgi:uncharacterized protein (TIGR00369 family)